MPSSMTMSSTVTTLLAVLSLLPTLLASPSPASAPSPLHFPLARRNTGPKSAADYAEIADNIRIKYGRPPILSTSSKLRRAGNVANIDTTNQQSDSSYFAPIQVGTPYVATSSFVLSSLSSIFGPIDCNSNFKCQVRRIIRYALGILRYFFVSFDCRLRKLSSISFMFF